MSPVVMSYTLKNVISWNAGTQISDVLLDIETAGIHTVKGFATIDEVALINVEVRPFILNLTLSELCHPCHAALLTTDLDDFAVIT